MLLITFGLKELMEGLGAVALVVTVLAYAWYTIRGQKVRVKTDAVKEWRDVADAQDTKIDMLTAKVNECEGEHRKCEKKINRITSFNLRLQAREVQYQRTIHRLERNAHLPLTDWLETPDDDEDLDS